MHGKYFQGAGGNGSINCCAVDKGDPATQELCFSVITMFFGCKI